MNWEKEAEVWEKRFDEVFNDWHKALLKIEELEKKLESRHNTLTIIDKFELEPPLG